ncbi:MAG: alpha/beta hydrolase [Parvibaculum sp.]|uniref:alpha/beta hydrolase n=1 Tax=Parvibaculum sp. TaxID=2024848 RepID=UPI002AB95D40|nr:alpha/beta hydrolase [Parvibaculum sp.]MDZ4382900.1 alpha/beta hydrolase [Parvibaculum sp.]
MQDVFGTLPPGAMDAFQREQAGTAAGAGDGWIVFDCETRNGLPVPLKLPDRLHPLWHDIAAALEHQDHIGAGIALTAHLALIAEGDDERPTRIMVLPDGAMVHALRGILRGEEMTAAELHLLKQLICGAGLAEAARADGVSHETRRTQFKSLSRKFGVRSQAELTSRAIVQLLLESGAARPTAHPGTDDRFIALADEFLPGARCHELQGPDGARYRFIDLGPADGRPVVFVHPQILPDFRPEDLGVLRAHGLRFVVPLRHGAMSVAGPDMNAAEHLDHACAGIELARTHFAGERADLLACLSGAAFGTEYARRYPERVASLAFVGAPARPAAGGSTTGRLRAGLFRLAAYDGALFARVMDFFGRRINQPETFRRLLANYYRPCPADLAIIEAEYAAPHGGERLRKLCAGSMRSIRQDFHHQTGPRWHDLPRDRFPVTFIHGAKDNTHPLPAIRALAGELGGHPVHIIPEAGQLLYYRHFAPLLDLYQRFLSAQGPQAGPKTGT